MTEPVEAIADLVNDLKERSPIIVIDKDVLPVVSTAGDVIDGTRVLDSQRSGHEGSLSETSVGLQDLTPNMTPNNIIFDARVIPFRYIMIHSGSWIQGRQMSLVNCMKCLSYRRYPRVMRVSEMTQL